MLRAAPVCSNELPPEAMEEISSRNTMKSIGAAMRSPTSTTRRRVRSLFAAKMAIMPPVKAIISAE